MSQDFMSPLHVSFLFKFQKSKESVQSVSKAVIKSKENKSKDSEIKCKVSLGTKLNKDHSFFAGRLREIRFIQKSLVFSIKASVLFDESIKDKVEIT